MDFMEKLSNGRKAFSDYDEYCSALFACADYKLSEYLKKMKVLYANEAGGFKNALHPDLEIAFDLCNRRLAEFSSDEPPILDGDDDFSKLLGAMAGDDVGESLSVEKMFSIITERAEVAVAGGVSLPLHTLIKKLELTDFSKFCLICAVLSSTQTNYAAVFQLINQNSSLTAPSFESAARIYFGSDFSITNTYGVMSEALEQLCQILDMTISETMPFSTILSPDKRFIDFLFGTNFLKPDKNYARFFRTLTDDNSPAPFLANSKQLAALKISYSDGIRIFELYGDEGSGRKFTIRHFCAEEGLRCIAIDCGKLFSYDFPFVNKVLWNLTRECILTDSCCCLTELSYREEEKGKFFAYMDLAFGKLLEKDVVVFTSSRDKLPMRDITKVDYTTLEFPPPNFTEREALWQHYGKEYVFADELDLNEMADKFLFTPGKIVNALKLGRRLSAMEGLDKITPECLFLACNNQMSSELAQKATKIKTTYTWDDIVMSKGQRQVLAYACDQMRFRKQVYEDWNYMRKYPYGRGLSVLLFGAPGTGKSMCAQVLANALNLELYRVDLSQVIDKYVGETEKSISMIFREAKKCNVVLFFDECDTLFAKRPDDGDANQALNNNKAALLLQEVEAYDGVSVLATNYKNNIDPAFFRRMKFIVEFQFPDSATREILWKTTIPKETPLAKDVDIRFLAEKFEFVGGNIKNCILNAAFLAAGDKNADGEVAMKHYVQAIRYEFIKTGKVFSRADFGQYAGLLEA
ncbi:ATPase AAA [Clostridia bacterium]|nr:ATPase AAA [Clostridia bacterium]